MKNKLRLALLNLKEKSSIYRSIPPVFLLNLPSNTRFFFTLDLCLKKGIMINMNLDNAISIAKAARKHSYAPHSNYFVGAALKGKSGTIYSGANIENDGIMSICAERVAFTKAISEGEKEFEYIVVCGGSSLDFLENCTPCGYCRQFMSEFVDKDFEIYLLGPDDKITKYSISDLLPHSFSL